MVAHSGKSNNLEMRLEKLYKLVKSLHESQKEEDYRRVVNAEIKYLDEVIIKEGYLGELIGGDCRLSTSVDLLTGLIIPMIQAKSILEIDPYDTFSLSTLANSWRNVHMFFEYRDEHVAANKTEFITERGYIRAEKKIKEALKLTRDASEINKLRSQLGRLYLDYGCFEMDPAGWEFAVSYLKKALKFSQYLDNEDKAIIYHNLGCAYLGIGQHHLAKRYVKKAIKFDSKSIESYVNMLLLSKSEKETKNYTKKIIDLVYRNPEEYSLHPFRETKNRVLAVKVEKGLGKKHSLLVFKEKKNMDKFEYEQELTAFIHDRIMNDNADYDVPHHLGVIPYKNKFIYATFYDYGPTLLKIMETAGRNDMIKSLVKVVDFLALIHARTPLDMINQDGDYKKEIKEFLKCLKRGGVKISAKTKLDFMGNYSVIDDILKSASKGVYKDAYPANWIIHDEGSIVALDFERCRVAPPQLDLAFLLDFADFLNQKEQDMLIKLYIRKFNKYNTDSPLEQLAKGKMSADPTKLDNGIDLKRVRDFGEFKRTYYYACVHRNLLTFRSYSRFLKTTMNGLKRYDKRSSELTFREAINHYHLLESKKKEERYQLQGLENAVNALYHIISSDERLGEEEREKLIKLKIFLEALDLYKYKKVRDYVDKLIENADQRNFVNPHLYHTEKWALRLKPDASLALRIAALTHDIDRVFVKGRDRRSAEKDYESYKEKHSKKCVRIITAQLRKHGFDERLISDVAYLVMNHERGGTDKSHLLYNDTNILKDADAIAFFEDFWLYRNLWGDEVARRKIEYSYGRISAKSRNMAEGLYKRSIRELDYHG